MSDLRIPIRAPQRSKLKRAELKRVYTTLPNHLLQAIHLEQPYLGVDTSTMIRILLSEAIKARRRERMEFQAHLASYGKPIQRAPLDDPSADPK